MPIPSTIADVRMNAAAGELARCLHAMRIAAFDLPAEDWRDLPPATKSLFVEHAAAAIGRLRPLVVVTGLQGRVIGHIGERHDDIAG